jgi:hypothetical protein
VFDEWNVSTDTGYALIHVSKRLQIRVLHHQKEGLLKLIRYDGRLAQQLLKAILNHLWQSGRMKHGAEDVDSTPPQPTTGLVIKI